MSPNSISLHVMLMKAEIQSLTTKNDSINVSTGGHDPLSGPDPSVENHSCMPLRVGPLNAKTIYLRESLI